MAEPTLNDQYNRLQHFMCCIGEKGGQLASKLKIGSDCCCDINTFELLHMYWNVLVCYDPTAENNCLSQAQVNAIWDDITKRCGICFSPYGSTYISSDCSMGNRITEEGDYRITEEGDRRVLECSVTAPSFNDGIGYMHIDDGNTPRFRVL